MNKNMDKVHTMKMKKREKLWRVTFETGEYETHDQEIKKLLTVSGSNGYTGNWNL